MPKTVKGETRADAGRTATPSAGPAKPATRSGAKSGAKPAREGIGGILGGVTLDAPARVPAMAGREAGGERPLRHPVASGMAFERVDNIYLMDPRKITLAGQYIRQFIEDAAFHQLKAAVAMERDIGQHVGIRVVGPTTNQQRVLVYGMRRWRAALDVGLEKVPVRDYGAISEEKAIELQMLENEIRADPHPVDTAYGFYLLSQQPDWNQKRIGEVFDKKKGYVSEMVRAGEAIARLREVDRQPLYTHPAVTVRAFQSIAQVKSVEARKDALLALLDGDGVVTPFALHDAMEGARGADSEPAPDATTPAPGSEQARRRKLVDEQVIYAKDIRHGRSFRVRWTDDDLRRDGTRIAEEFRAAFLDEYGRLLHRTAVLHGTVPGHGSTETPKIAELVAGAAHEAARVDARIIGTIRPAGAAPSAGQEDDHA